ncbi:PilZ domain-containing protein [Campylobacter showae]|uniref:Type IV pilus assembly protein PilZ n=1 Tax=Campylobacter showae RM3277 TaxID=553219 RepID=C6RE99_9BACT|nr:PilZ domain-containing protein [Campylobacter showae]EET80275.1 type IV pilus assembly protein PilZ [Campylobacter showae RM3277]QCD48268.1 PilZ domain-containing protein [Campylobacter showae]
MNSTYNDSSFMREDAVTVFARVRNDNRQVHFLNLYNGVKVECMGEVEHVEDDTVVCKVALEQILAMKEEQNAYIVRDEYFSENLRADIIGFDLANLTVTLQNFTYMQNLHANLRKHQRVYPDRYTRVILTQNGSEISGNLYDISRGGLGVVSLDDGEFKEGEPINAKFELSILDEASDSNKNIEIDTNLKLVAALRYKGAMRYCCELADKDGAGEDIAKFAKRRVIETLEELKEQLKTYQ